MHAQCRELTTWAAMIFSEYYTYTPRQVLLFVLTGTQKRKADVDEKVNSAPASNEHCQRREEECNDKESNVSAGIRYGHVESEKGKEIKPKFFRVPGKLGSSLALCTALLGRGASPMHMHTHTFTPSRICSRIDRSSMVKHRVGVFYFNNIESYHRFRAVDQLDWVGA